MTWTSRDGCTDMDSLGETTTSTSCGPGFTIRTIVRSAIGDDSARVRDPQWIEQVVRLAIRALA
jgi:hypothetical protein